MAICKSLWALSTISLAAVSAFAQSPQNLGPVRSASAVIPGTTMHRCGTPSTRVAGPIDHPDCDSFNTNPLASYEGALLRIPVVVHILHRTNGVGNLTDPQVQSQITVLNEDFRATAGTAGSPGYDSNIEFFLATTTPQGQPTTGITRHANNSWHNDSGSYWNSVAWDTSRYLNIYVNNPGGGGILGYVPALPSGGSVLNTAADRVVCYYQAFGRPSSAFPFNAGRTCTHEVGHYLGLFHTFDGGCGFGSCYTSGDLICDTNAESNPRFGCQPNGSSCGSVDPARNYMDYSDDSCMNNFTQEQVRRMRCTLQHYRPNLAEPAGPTGPLASTAIRTGPGNLNSNYNCNAPTLGTTMTASVIAFNLGYQFAAVYGHTGAGSSPIGNYTLLIDQSSPFVIELPLQALSSGIFTSWSVPIPNVASLAGLPIKTQALLLGPTDWALTNARDLVVGN